MDLTIEKVVADLQDIANAQRESAIPKPTIKFDAEGNFTLSSELRSMMNSHTVIGTEEVTRNNITVKKNKYGNNRIGFLVNGNNLVMMVTSAETLPAIGGTLRFSLSGFAKDTVKTNYSEVITEHFTKQSAIDSDWTLVAKEINASPAGSVCVLELLTPVKTPSVKLTAKESAAIDLATEDNDIEEVITEVNIAEEIEEIGDELLQMQEINVTHHTDIILEE